jgi:tripartite-type tricarboxylate transporter receptor subunit TctC
MIARRGVVGGLLALGTAGGSFAADFPARPMNWIVPFPPGGSNDIFSRPIAAFVGHRLHQPVVVENRGGAGGTIGGMIAARSKPDGCTLLVVNPSLTFASIVYAESGFDLMRDFAPVSGMAQVPVALVVNPEKVAARDVAAFLALARRSPGAINIGSSGLGTIPHLAIELLQQRTGVVLTHVPYRGGGPALQDMMAGTIDATFTPLSTVASYVQSGRLRALAVANRRRESLLPEVPTMDEAGLADFRATIWFGLFAPRRTPDAVLDRLHGAAQAALEEDRIKALWIEQGARVEPESRADFARFVAADAARWSRIARLANVKLE